MKIKTGQTIYESIVSVDTNNYPISAATMTTHLFKDGVLYIESPISISLTNAENAIFTASWSGASYGQYQLYAKNDITNLIYMSDIYLVVPDDEAGMNVYVGL